MDDRNDTPFGDQGAENVPPEELLQEIVFGPSASEVDAARKIFREGLVPATQSIVHLAAFSKNDRIRLDASKYVVERNLGKVAEKLAMGDVWEKLFSDIAATKE